MASPYKRPPIAEAVIEVRVDGQLERSVLDKLQRHFLDEYPISHENQMLQVEVGGGSDSKLLQQFQGYRLTGKDGTETIMVSPFSIATTRLAPYEGWEKLAAKAKQNWLVWKRHVGYRKVIRVGVRYINRIDIPDPGEGRIEVDDYLRFSPRVPQEAFLGMSNFAINATIPLGKDDCNLVLNVGTVPSPLVKNISFVLDLDLSRVVNLPQNDDALWTFIERMREHKNYVFEACITDVTRKLFS